MKRTTEQLFFRGTWICISLILIATGSMNNVHAQTERLWGTYIGGTGNYDDDVLDIAADPYGNVYAVGVTNSTTNIAFGGFQTTYGGGILDGYLVKVDAMGNRVWSTYYGSSGLDRLEAVTTDDSGYVYVAGGSDSNTGIVTVGAFDSTQSGIFDAIIVKFDGNGNRIWATYFGGPGTDGAYGIAVDDSGNVYITGVTSSQSQIAYNGFQNTQGGPSQTDDIFVAKFNSSGMRVWATYYGGLQDERADDIAIDSDNNIYVSGNAESPGLGYNGFQNYCLGACDILVKFDANCNRLWATYFNNTEEFGSSVAVDTNGNVYLGGWTRCDTAISYNGFQNIMGGFGGNGSSDNFLVKFDTNGNRIWSTYYGGSGSEYDVGLSTDLAGNIYMTAVTSSSDSLFYNGFQSAIGNLGGPGAYVVKFDPSGNRIASTHYGGSSGAYGYAVAADRYGNVFLAGKTSSSSGIAYNGFQNTLYGGEDGYLVKFDSCNSGPAAPGPISGSITLCAGTVTTYSVNPIPGITSYSWSLPGGWTGSSTTNTITVTAGNSDGFISVVANNACGAGVPQNIAVTISPNVSLDLSMIDTLCVNDAPAQLNGGLPSGGTYSGPGVGGNTFDPSVAGAGTFAVTYTFTDSAGCTNFTSASIYVGSCAGIADEPLSETIKTYPNPAGDKIYIGNPPMDDYVIRIFASDGKIVAEQSNQPEVDVSLLAPGIYFIEVSSGETVSREKMVIAR